MVALCTALGVLTLPATAQASPMPANGPVWLPACSQSQTIESSNPDETITGTAVQGAEPLAVAGATVSVIPLDKTDQFLFDYTHCVVTNDQGEFVLDAGVSGFPHWVVIDPPSGNATLGSRAMSLVGPTGSAGTLNLTATASVSGTVRFVVDGGAAYTLEQAVADAGPTWVVVCILAATDLVSCGTVGDRGESQMSFRIGLPDGFDPTGKRVLTFVRSANGLSKFEFDETLAAGALNNLVIDIAMGAEPSNGCESDGAPNFTGTVTAGGQPYVGSRVTPYLRNAHVDNQPGWAHQSFGLEATTDVNGDFQFCIDLESSNLNWWFEQGSKPEIQFVATSLERGLNATLGDSASPIISIANRSCNASCSAVAIAMQTPTLKGRIVGAQQLEILYDVAQFFTVVTFARAGLDPDGDFAVAFPFTEALSAYSVRAAADGDNDLPVKGAAVWRVPSLPLTIVEELPAATHRVEMLKPSGAQMGQNDQVYSELRSTDGAVCSDPTRGNWDWYEAGCAVQVSRSLKGFSASLSAGNYEARIQGQLDGAQIPPTTFSFTVDAQGHVVNKPDNLFRPDDADRWYFRLESTRFSFDVRDAAGQQVSVGARTVIERVNPGARWYDFAPGMALKADGTWGWTPDGSGADGIYRLRVEPPANRLDIGYTSRFFKMSGSGSSAVVTHLCAMPYAPNGVFLEQDQLLFIGDADCTAYVPSDGYSNTSLRIQMDQPNLTFDICGPGCSSLSVGDFIHPDVEVRRPMVAIQTVPDTADPVQYFLQRFNDTWLYRTQVQPGGMGIELPVPANGIDLFTLEMMPPFGNTDLLTAVTKYLLIVSKSAGTAPVGWENGWYLCESDACTVRTPLAADGSGLRTLGNVVLPRSKIVLRAQRPDGTFLPRGRVNVQRQQSCWWDAERLCFEYVRSLESRLIDGFIGLDLPPGIYELQVNPPYNDTSNDAPGRVLIEVGSNGLVSRATASGVTLNQAGTMADPLPLKLAVPNVVAVVRADGAIRQFVGVGLERWDLVMQQWNWANQWSQADAQGVVRFNLDEGRWRLRAWPQGNDAGVFTEALLEIEVNAQRTITTVSAQAYTPGDPIFVDYGVPNLRGVVKGPAGAPIAMAGLGLQEWNGQNFQGGSWANTRGNGAYAFTITPDDNAATYYRLEVNPPAGQGVRTARFLYAPTASATGRYMCFIEREAVGTGQEPACASQPPTESTFDITLAGPNVTGVVEGALGGDAPAPRAAWVYARKWNGSWFDWIDQWSEARAGSGTFDFVLDAPGFYEITAEPRVGSGFTKTSLYVSVSATSGPDAYCLSSVVSENGRVEPNLDDCRPPPVGGRVPLVLIGANLRGAASYRVSNSAGTTTLEGNLREGWVEVFDTTGEWPQWVDSVGLSQSGGFALRLESRSNITATRYQVVVSPSSWNPQISALNLGKERHTLWATTSAQNTTVLCQNDPAVGACQVLDTLAMVLGGGNVSGAVSIPGGASTVRDAQVGVERWDTTVGYWIWANEWANTGDGGRFALSLEPGSHYRLNVRPPWGNSDYSPSAVIIRVDDNGWCQVDVGTQSCNAYATTLAVQLGEPNVRATVLAAGAAQRDVWVAIERQEVVNEVSRWQWTGNATNTGANGNVGLRVDGAGTYRVVVEAPWSSSAQDLTRFTREFTVDAGGAVTWSTGTEVSDGRAQLSYPASNAVFEVQDATGTNVRDAWVYVERWVTDRWEWAEIFGSTRSNGRVALRLPDAAEGFIDTYRVTVNPPWNRSGLARFSTEVTVSGSTVNRNAGFTLAFPSSNVSGVILATGAADGASTVPNRFGWIEVRGADDSWIEGTSTNQTGRFSLYLPNPAGEGGTTVYTLIAHPNYGQLSARPMRLTVTVSGQNAALVGCSYAANGASCLTDTGATEVSAGFDFVPPNFIVTVTTSAGSSPGPVGGAFVRITDEGDGSFVDLVTDNSGTAQVNLATGRTYRVRVVWVNGSVVTTGQSSGLVLGDAPAVVNVSIEL